MVHVAIWSVDHYWYSGASVPLGGGIPIAPGDGRRVPQAPSGSGGPIN